MRSMLLPDNMKACTTLCDRDNVRTWCYVINEIWHSDNVLAWCNLPCVKAWEPWKADRWAEQQLTWKQTTAESPALNTMCLYSTYWHIRTLFRFPYNTVYTNAPPQSTEACTLWSVGHVHAAWSRHVAPEQHANVLNPTSHIFMYVITLHILICLITPYVLSF